MRIRSAKNTLEVTKLRLMLLRIWFMKNLITFIRVGVLVLIVLMLCGQINENTPVLGILVYPIFKPLIDSINQIIEQQNANNIASFASTALSILITVSVFTIKIKSISQNDIKSKDMKIALIKGGLYFNENGKLVKKVEKATGTDINGDGVVNEEDVVKDDGFFKGIFRAISEFITVITTDIGEDELAEEKLQEAVISIDAVEAKEVLDELDKNIITNVLDKTAELVNKQFDIAIEKAEEEDLKDDGVLNSTEHLRDENCEVNKIRSRFLKFIHMKKKEINDMDDCEQECGEELTEENSDKKENVVENTETKNTVLTSDSTESIRAAIMRKYR